MLWVYVSTKGRHPSPTHRLKDDPTTDVKSVLLFYVWCEVGEHWNFSLEDLAHNGSYGGLEEHRLGGVPVWTAQVAQGCRHSSCCVWEADPLIFQEVVSPWCLHHWAKWASLPCAEGRADERIQIQQPFIVSKQKRAHMCQFINYCFH